MRNDPNHETTDPWVDDQMKNLNPPSDWPSNADRALDILLKRNEARREGTGRQWSRAALTATALVAVCLVVALLPWRVLWSSVTRPQVQEPVFSTTVGAVIARPSVSTENVAVPTAPVLPSLPAEPETIEPEVTQDAPPASSQKGIPRCKIAAPQYTDIAREARLQGTVVVAAIVQKDGVIVVTRVVRGLGLGLDESAIAAVEQSQCLPGTIDGMPVDVQMNVQIKFTLR